MEGDILSNIDWNLVRPIFRDMDLPINPLYYPELARTGSGSAVLGRTLSRREGKVVKKSHKSSDMPGGSIARERRGKEQNDHLL